MENPENKKSGTHESGTWAVRTNNLGVNALLPEVVSLGPRWKLMLTILPLRLKKSCEYFPLRAKRLGILPISSIMCAMWSKIEGVRRTGSRTGCKRGFSMNSFSRTSCSTTNKTKNTQGEGRLGRPRIISGGWSPDSSWLVPFWSLEAYLHLYFYFVYIPKFR